ncbi:MAG: 3-oxoacyl-[acyl-carrier protein] reductase [Verrucomicrobia bacterium]|nr:MAG: 3-oxoacyl-[acyl-carrier protein] reductase [Verrucomicrobiota bacterium]
MKTPRVIFITGTSRGLGLGLAEHFLAQGDIVAGCSRAPATLTHERYSHCSLDVSDEPAVVAAVRAAVRQHGHIDALINNAGIATMNHALLSTAAAAQQIFATNFHGTFLFCREVAKTMVRRKSGRIVNFATVATPLRLEGESLYAASKAAVESFTQVLARELGPAGVTVNAVGPTPVPTDLVKNVPRAKMDALLARQAIQRFGTISDVINVVEFFLAPQSEFITGQVIYLGGVSG